MSDIALIIEPRTRDLGGFQVGRVLPHRRRRMVGPFIFFDQIGPAEFAPGKGIDVRPHPHIGLATVTYLFDGEIRHRDSLGFDLNILPGDVNWMTAGRGIVHSERTDSPTRDAGHRLFGIQSWVALPDGDEEAKPEFHHYPKDSLPVIESDGVKMRLIAGSAFERTSPVKTFSPIFYLGVEAEAGADIPFPEDYSERAMHIVEGEASVNGVIYEGGRMIIFDQAARPDIKMIKAGRLILLGGEPVGERLIWWNLVSSSQERLERAKEDWRQSAAQGFCDAVFSLPPGEDEYIPLPDQ